MSATPILDCEVPLPGRPRRGTDPNAVTALVAFVIIIAIAFVGPMVGLPRPNTWINALLSAAGGWSLPGLLWTLALAWAGYLASMAVHELGHVFAGKIAGLAYHSVRVGPFQFDRRLALTLDWRLASLFTGLTVTLPIGKERIGRRSVVMVAGGSLANLLSAGLILLLPFRMGVFWTVFVGASLLQGVVELIPLRGAIGWSDGKILFNILRRSAWGERWLALARLKAEVLDQTPFADLSRDALTAAVAIRDASAETVSAHSFAYAQAYHSNDVDRAAQMLEVCLAHAHHVPALREALLSDAATFQAEKRKKPALARQWLQVLGPGTGSWHILRVEASILQAEGKLEAAVEKLKECEVAANALPPDQRTVALGIVVPWRTRIEGWIEYLGPPEA